jgi:FkbM family methyltransferase
MKLLVKRLIPWQVLALLRALRPKTWREARSVAPLPSYLRILHLAETPPGAIAKPLRVRLFELGGAGVGLRPGTSDLKVLWDTISGRFHLPPADLRPRVIWDLGANIGLTVAHFLAVYPEARVVAVEPEPSNAALARENVRRWNGRVRVVEAAVWHEDTELALTVEPGDEYGARVGANAGGHRVAAKSLNTLLADEETVDFLKMDIEGAEQTVLTQNTDWAEKVGCIKVELHGAYTAAACIDDLRRLGFAAEPDRVHNQCVVGRRAGAAR